MEDSIRRELLYGKVVVSQSEITEEEVQLTLEEVLRFCKPYLPYVAQLTRLDAFPVGKHPAYRCRYRSVDPNTRVVTIARLASRRIKTPSRDRLERATGERVITLDLVVSSKADLILDCTIQDLYREEPFMICSRSWSSIAAVPELICLLRRLKTGVSVQQYMVDILRGLRLIAELTVRAKKDHLKQYRTMRHRLSELVDRIECPPMYARDFNYDGYEVRREKRR